MPHNTAEHFSDLTGDVRIDALMAGSRWIESTVTFAFPQSADAYGYEGGHPDENFQPFPAAWEAFCRTLLAEVSSFTGLTFQEDVESEGSLRWGRYDDPHNIATGHQPDSNEGGGDMWFPNVDRRDPVNGNGADRSFRHELGHALGLSHPHDGLGSPMPLTLDSQDYSAESYRLHTDYQSGDYSGNDGGSQSYMMLDIFALQHLYGANFNFNAGHTTYQFDANGQMFVNGVGTGAPAFAKILRTIWDGGGVDTYDFSNFSANQSINLAPGAWSTLDQDLVVLRARRDADLDDVYELNMYSPGNVANALQYNNDPRSLIENAIGGAGNDTIIGNAAANRLDGGGGNDILNGSAGADVMIGWTGNDTYYVDHVGDSTVEDVNEGVDTVVATRSWAVASNFERVYLQGTGDFNVAGNGLANTLKGNSGDNWINGSFGKDILTGGGGRDSFIFNREIKASNVDTITDYDVVRDVIRIDNAVFAGIGPAGALGAGAFYAGAAAHDADDRIIYDQTTGKLFFDIDGLGGAAQQHFATLSTKPGGMSAAEFIII